MVARVTKPGMARGGWQRCFGGGIDDCQQRSLGNFQVETLKGLNDQLQDISKQRQSSDAKCLGKLDGFESKDLERE